MSIENICFLILLGVGAILLVAITVSAFIALRRGQPFGKTLKSWVREVVLIIAGL